ncbi:entericidin A/B family lipoprotein [Candidatus Accumulibacter sp. ACC003]|nr:entericidin A/B family lipoprotein [Candidatus Accumulibacter sp. ACC003]
MNRLTMIFVVLVVSTSLAACNTMQGVGKDVAKGGQAIEKAAR